MHRNHCFKLLHGNLKQYVAYTSVCILSTSAFYTPKKTSLSDTFLFFRCVISVSKGKANTEKLNTDKANECKSVLVMSKKPTPINTNKMA